MSRGISTDNPIVLFGNIGPDVVRITQIYDPDNDQYIPTEDITVQDKTYYTRSYANRTITFTPVSISSTSPVNPKEKGWYEVNEAHADQTGKYVPAVNSVVVCDTDYGNFKERSILIVESVDDQGDNPTFKSILVPSINGQDTEASTRIVDYGNDRFMLYLEKDEDLIRACPDRKLMLYGHRLYAYALRDAKGHSIAVPDKSLIGITNDALIPYSGETTTSLTLTKDKLSGNQGKLFAIKVGANYRTVIIPDPTSASVRCKTLDEYYLSGKTYYLEVYDQTGKKSYRQLVPGTDYNVYPKQGDKEPTKVGYLLSGDDPGYARIFVRGDQFINNYSGAGYQEFQGWITESTNPDASIRYPERCYLKPGVNLSSGETVTMEVYEFEGDAYRMVLSLTLIVKPGSVLNPTTKITKQLDNFSVVVQNAEFDTDGTVKLEVGRTIQELGWIFHPTLNFNDGSSEVVPIDNVQSFAYGIENINSANVGQIFSVLFKFFPTEVSGVFENMSKNFVSTTLRVKVVAGASTTVRKVSTIPVWDYKTGKYVFMFLPYNNEFTEPKLISEGSAVGGSMNLLFNNASYKDPNGSVLALDPKMLGENFGLYEHGRLAYVVKKDGYESDVYRQNVAMRLQPWTDMGIAAKWLIGSFRTDTSVIEEYTSGEVPYGSVTDAIRPWIECVPAETGTGYTLYIGRATVDSFMNKTEFLKNYFTKAYPDPVDVDNDGMTDAVNRYRIRTIAEVDTYDALSSEYALEGVEYFDKSGTLVPTVPGKTKVNRYTIKVQAGFRYFTFDETTSTYTEVIGTVVGTVLNADQRTSWFLQRLRPITSDWKEIPEQFSMNNAAINLVINGENISGSRYYPTNTLGGPLPTVVGDDDLLNTQVMGSVIVEFAVKDQDTVDYKWVYGVPVEVRFPYSPTADATYKSGVQYFVFDATNNRFVNDTAYEVNKEIPSTPQRFVKVV